MKTRASQYGTTMSEKENSTRPFTITSKSWTLSIKRKREAHGPWPRRERADPAVPKVPLRGGVPSKQNAYILRAQTQRSQRMVNELRTLREMETDSWLIFDFLFLESRAEAKIIDTVYVISNCFQFFGRK